MKQKDLKIDFRYLTGNIACLSVDSISGESVHNDINNEEAIIIFNSLVGEKADCQTVKSLLKENAELKKQLDKAHDELYTLKNKYNIRLLNQISENIEPDCEDYYLAEIETKAHKYDLIQNQQKVFIKYMNSCIKELEKESLNKLQNTINLGIIDITKTILQKYKSIIGENSK